MPPEGAAAADDADEVLDVVGAEAGDGVVDALLEEQAPIATAVTRAKAGRAKEL